MIRVLPSDLVNQIAAGEVVERPASVVKELIENAIDADSSSIDVFVENGGQSYICVKDNGSGMTASDLELCVQRHATSKLSGKNLLEIRTFGFRGEALPSICSISRVEIKSKTLNDDLGWMLCLDGGVEVKKEPIRLETGTVITVRDLFYKTPARLKFLKSSSAELAASTLQVRLLALSNPHVAFSFVSGEKRLFSYVAKDTSIARMQDVMGTEFCENGVQVQYDLDGITITGIASYPTYHKNGGQYIFVNKRPVKDRGLAGAIKVAYQRVLIPGEQPSYVLFLNMDPQEVDANVHPAKTEVRFRSQGRVRSAIITAIEQALSTTKQTASNFSDKFMSTCERRNDYSRGLPWEENMPIGHSPFHPPYEVARHPEGHTFGQNSKGEIKGNASLMRDDFLSPINELQADYARNEHELPSSDPLNPSLGTPKAQVFDSFIIAQNGNEMFLIDQHAAHERIVYEQIDQCLTLDNAGNVIWTGPTQRVMFPICVEPSKITNSDLEDSIKGLRAIGFECVINVDGQSADSGPIAISAIPKICESLDVAALVCDIIDEISECEDKSSLLEAIHKMFATYACHHSIRANHPLNEAEMSALLRQIEGTPRSGQCNHGRPTYVKLLRKDIERLFERTG